MAIAANFRKHPEAMALQLVLVFTRFVWHTSRPTTRAGRAIRAAVGRAFKTAPKVVYPVKPTTPQWCRDLGRLMRKLGQSVKDAQILIDFYADVEQFSQAETIPAVGEMYQGKVMTVAKHRRLTRLQIIHYEENSGDPELAKIAAWRKKSLGKGRQEPEGPEFFSLF